MKPDNSVDVRFKAAILDAAKAYIAKGWPVFPVHSIDANGECTCGMANCSDAGKHPVVQHGLKEGTRDAAKIDEWFGPEAPLRNIGIVTGEVSGITVIDIDIGHGKFGAESWAEAIQEHGEPVTLVSQTGSGGMHFLFQYNSALKTASDVLGKGIDCRNDGGYIVAPPSRHRSGGTYAWIDPAQPLAALPAHLSRRKEARGRPKKNDLYRNKYTVEQVADMLAVVPSDDRDLWRNVGIILGREFNRIDEAWKVYTDWANKAGGKKGRNHDEIMHEAFYDISQQQGEKELSLGTIVKAAMDNGWAPKLGRVPINNFFYYAPENSYIYKPTVDHWIAPSVDAAVSPVNENGKILKASDWLRANKLITSMTCDPAIDEMVTDGFDCREGELVAVDGAAVFNTYRKPTIELGDARLAGPFLNHVAMLFNKPGDADQFLDYMAHRVQKPGEKPRFALLIAGGQGVGKDTAVTMCGPAIGEWNIANIEPAAVQSNFNEYAAATLVRISEAANLHEMTKWAFNEQCKVLIAGNPDTLIINPKYGRKYSVRMHCGVIITTNNLASGIYIPTDDRRYDVIDCATLEEMGLQDEVVRREYFGEFWGWFNTGGANHIAALLRNRDISQFSANNGQRKTEAHQSVVQSGRERHAWLYDILEELGDPKFISFPTIRELAKRNREDTSNPGKFGVRAKSALEDAKYFKYLSR